jgi:hypothetical protein
MEPVMREAIRTARLTLRYLHPADLCVVHAMHSSEGHTVGDEPAPSAASDRRWPADPARALVRPDSQP